MLHAVVLIVALNSVLALPQSRIVGGRPASAYQIPYQVSIEFLDEHHCGGAILSPTLVITAAHCTDAFLARFLSIRAGSLAREDGGQKVKVNNYVNHPKFHKKTLDYDVSIVQLVKPLVFGQGVNFIKLPKSGEEQPTSSLAVISGWGRTTEKGKLSNVLLYAQVPILDRRTCEKYVAGFTDRMICAAQLTGGIDACNLDSGGPMVIGDKLVGIISWGVGCARENSPGVYTYVAALRNWIDSTVNDLTPNGMY